MNNLLDIPFSLIALIGLLLLSLPAPAQTVITGRVTTKGEAVVDAQVMALNPADSTVLAYSFTEEGGQYRLSFTSSIPRVLLTAFGMEIKRTYREIENRSQTVDLEAEPQVYELREAEVQATKIHIAGDTLRYDVSAFEKQGDMVIGDVLKRMPGITVDPGGLIRYQGRPINKFYIEGSDVLLGRYGMATENISSKDVEEVQVMQNHQPVKALEDLVPSQEAALNLLLRDSAKGTWLAHGEAKAGLELPSRLAYEGSLVGMYFTKPRQHIYSLKANNSGRDILSELRSFTTSSPLPYLTLTSLVLPETPPLDPERYRDNETQAVGLTNLWKVGVEREVNGNLIYTHDRDRRRGSSQTIYYLPGGEEQLIDEEIATTGQEHHLEGELRYNRNSSDTYFNNLTELRASWRTDDGWVRTPDEISQELRDRSFTAQNTTHVVRRGEGMNAWEIYWQSAAASEPHRLRVSPGLYGERLGLPVSYGALAQEVRHSAILSNLRLSLLAPLRSKSHRTTLSPSIRINGLHQRLSSEMSAEGETGETLPLPMPEQYRNDLAFSRLYAEAAVDLRTKWRRGRLFFYLPLGYRYTALQEQEGEALFRRGKLRFDPQVVLEYYPHIDVKLTISGSIYTTDPGLTDLYSGYILRDYRRLQRYDADPYTARVYDGRLKGEYKNVFDMFFASGEIGYSHFTSDVISSLSLDGPLAVSRRVALPNSVDDLTADLRASKSYYYHAINLSLRLMGGLGRGQLLRQETLMDYHSQSVGVEAKGDGKVIGDILLLAYRTRWQAYRMRSGEEPWTDPVHSLSQRLTLTWTPTKSFSLESSVDHYYHNLTSGRKNFLLADIGLRYSTSRVHYTLDWTNIFNTGAYTDATLSDLISYSRSYTIRPMRIMIGIRLKLL